MRSLGYDERVIHAAVSHGWGLSADVEPVHEMEKVLFATDELTGLIGACAKVHPSGDVKDLSVKSVRKKFKTPAFAAGCSRDVIMKGAGMLGWDIDTLIERTLKAMQSFDLPAEV